MSVRLYIFFLTLSFLCWVGCDWDYRRDAAVAMAVVAKIIQPPTVLLTSQILYTENVGGFVKKMRPPSSSSCHMIHQATGPTALCVVLIIHARKCK